jgi:myo-inositol-1(or 4)-monophosphatase
MRAALAGATAARAAQMGGLDATQKSADKNDLVTQGDEASQAAILTILPRTIANAPVGMLAEEKGAIDTPGAKLRWVVDPIDGTLPYSRGEPFWCVSIALQERQSKGWKSTLGILYQASPNDTAEHLTGRLFWSEGEGAFARDLKNDKQAQLARPAAFPALAEFSASGAYSAWAKEEFARRDIATRFRRSICHAVTELLLGNLSAVVQDAGPLEWDVAAILPIARAAGVHVLARRMDAVTGCDRYATVFAWDKDLFEVFCGHMPAPAG